MNNSIQSVRYLLALMIVIHHYVFPPYNPFGDFPVAFFFILSGYVMMMGYGDKVMSKEFDYIHYLRRRICKIYPLHFIMLVVGILPLVVSIILHFDSEKMIMLINSLPSFLLVQSFFSDISIRYAGNPVSWFLSSIIFCYFCAPLLFRVIKCRFKTVLFSLLFAIILYVLLLLWILQFDTVNYIIYSCPPIRLLDFSLGAVLYEFICRISLKKSFSYTYKTSIEISTLIIIALAMSLEKIVGIRVELASLYWIPSIYLISVLAIMARVRGGRFQDYSIGVHYVGSENIRLQSI